VLPPLLGDWSDRLGRLCSHSGRWRPGSGRPCTWSSAPSTPGPTLQLIVQPRSDSRLRRPCAPWAVSPPARHLPVGRCRHYVPGGLRVLTIRADRVAEATAFHSADLTRFGLPARVHA